MLDVLRSERRTEVELMVITAPGATWEHRVEGFDEIDFSVMPDQTAGVHYIYGVQPGDYPVFLVDKIGRLVSRDQPFSVSLVDQLMRRIRELDAE